MKRTTLIVIVLMAELFASEPTQAQGTLYLSNLDQPSTGSLAVGSDSWMAAIFRTGANVSGYCLDSIELGMTDASGNPSGFTVMLYSAFIDRRVFPESSLGSLSGSDPAGGGIFTYTAPNITLLPSTDYLIVLTAATPLAGGFYNWSIANTGSYSSSDGWFPVDLYDSSSDGSRWLSHLSNPLQFAVYATAVPEPATYALAGLGLAALSFWRLRQTK